MLTIGADPELFVRNPEGKFISAVGRFGGTKEEPKPMYELGAGFAIQEDNVAVEFNIPTVQLGLSGAFAAVIEQAVTEIEKRAQAQGLTLAIVPSAIFDADQLRTRAARTFGCDPDFNVWTLRPNPRPNAKNKRLRSCGGHIHVGGDISDRIGLGRAMDLFVGCPSIMFDEDSARRELYGKAGAIREKPYGVEYRTVSNFWIKSKQFSEMVHDQTVQAVAFVRDGREISDEDAHKIIRCINNSDKDALRDLTKTYGLRY